MFLFLTHFRPTCSRIYTFAILYSTAKVIKVFSTRTKVGLQYTFSVVRVAQSLFFLSWLVDFQWGSCGSIFSGLCHGWQTFSGVRVSQSLVLCVMVGRLLYYNIVFWQIFSGVRVAQSSFLCHGWQIFSGVRVAQSLVFCVMVGRFFMGFVWLNLQSSA